MAQETSSFRYRTIVEVAIISLIIYYFLFTSGLSTSSSSSASNHDVQEPAASQSRAKIESLVTSDPNLNCAPHRFQNVHILCTSPLVIYIDGFLSNAEADHLINISSVSTPFLSGPNITFN